jgi:hypothetical protein
MNSFIALQPIHTPYSHIIQYLSSLSFPSQTHYPMPCPKSSPVFPTSFKHGDFPVSKLSFFPVDIASERGSFTSAPSSDLSTVPSPACSPHYSRYHSAPRSARTSPPQKRSWEDHRNLPPTRSLLLLELCVSAC